MLIQFLTIRPGICCLVLLVLAGCDRPAGTGPLKDDRQKLSYAFGVDIATGWKQTDFDTDAAIRGMSDGVEGNTRLMTAETAQKALQEFRDGQNKDSSPFPFKDWREKAGYACGFNTGACWKIFKADIDIPGVRRGIKDFQAQTNLVSSEDARAAVTQFSRDLLARIQEARKKLGEKNRREGEEFLKKNQMKPDVITLPSGLQYKVLARGQGKSPEPEDYVTVSCRGTLLDGTQIENTDQIPNKECVFCMRSIIRGWQEALGLMKPGDKWQLFIPQDLAYADEGASNVGPNATLIYTLELRGILPGQPQPSTEQIRAENSK